MIGSRDRVVGRCGDELRFGAADRCERGSRGRRPMFVLRDLQDAYDALGQQSCSGTPTVCQPLWQTDPLAGGNWSAVTGYAAIASGRVYIPAYANVAPLDEVLEVRVFDLHGTTSCTGTPVVCQPLWINRFLGPGYATPAQINGLSIANGTLYAYSNIGYTSSPAAPNEHLAAFDADGLASCEGTPVVCSPLWYASSAATAPVVANGVLFAGTRAFDAAGNDNCSGTPTTCSPLWEDGSALNAESAVADGRLYSVTQLAPGGNLTLRVYRLA